AGDLVLDRAEAQPVVARAVQPGAVDAAVAEAALVRGVAARLGGGQAPFHDQVVELAEAALAGHLVVDQLALQPQGAVLADVAADVEVVAGARLGLLDRVVHVQGGPGQAVALALQAEAEQAVDPRVVAGGGEGVVLVQVGAVGGEHAVLLLAGAGAPFVVEAGHADHAQLQAVAELERGAAAGAEAEVRVDAVLLLQDVQVGVVEPRAELADRGGAEVGTGHRLAAADHLGRQVAHAVVIAPPVAVAAAVVGQAGLAGGDAVAADADVELQERLFRHHQALQVDLAAAQPAGVSHRIGLLPGTALPRLGREQDQRQ